MHPQMETGTHSSSNILNAIGRHEVLRGPPVGIVPFLMLHRVTSHSTAAIMNGVRKVCERPAFMCVLVLQFLSHGDAAPVF
jgi:hypothetical protein